MEDLLEQSMIAQRTVKDHLSANYDGDLSKVSTANPHAVSEECYFALQGSQEAWKQQEDWWKKRILGKEEESNRIKRKRRKNKVGIPTFGNRKSHLPSSVVTFTQLHSAAKLFFQHFFFYIFYLKIVIFVLILRYRDKQPHYLLLPSLFSHVSTCYRIETCFIEHKDIFPYALYYTFSKSIFRKVKSNYCKLKREANMRKRRTTCNSQ